MRTRSHAPRGLTLMANRRLEPPRPVTRVLHECELRRLYFTQTPTGCPKPPAGRYTVSQCLGTVVRAFAAELVLS